MSSHVIFTKLFFLVVFLYLCFELRLFWSSNSRRSPLRPSDSRDALDVGDLETSQAEVKNLSTTIQWCRIKPASGWSNGREKLDNRKLNSWRMWKMLDLLWSFIFRSIPCQQERFQRHPCKPQFLSRLILPRASSTICAGVRLKRDWGEFKCCERLKDALRRYRKVYAPQKLWQVYFGAKMPPQESHFPLGEVSNLFWVAAKLVRNSVRGVLIFT